MIAVSKASYLFKATGLKRTDYIVERSDYWLERSDLERSDHGTKWPDTFLLISALLPQSICVGGIYQSVRTAYLTFADFEEVSNLLTYSMAVKLS